MLEQDYIMRAIHDMVRTLFKLLFKVDTDSPTADLISNDRIRENLIRLQRMIDSGRINEAENELYRGLDHNDLQCLEAALLFYSYINGKDNDFLEEHEYCREEVNTGIKDILAEFNMGNMGDAFISDDEPQMDRTEKKAKRHFFSRNNRK